MGGAGTPPACTPCQKRGFRILDGGIRSSVSDRTLEEFAAIVNPIVRGWLNYYGRLFRSELGPVLRRINVYLVRWAMNKYKRLRSRPRRARAWLVAAYWRQPELFEHWRAGMRPDGWTVGAV